MSRMIILSPTYIVTHSILGGKVGLAIENDYCHDLLKIIFRTGLAFLLIIPYNHICCHKRARGPMDMT